MNEPTNQPRDDASAESVDDQGRLMDDVACRRCGYNLRSLETDAVCPECGAAVAISLHGFYLRFAPLAWVRRLALGAKLLIASIVTAIVGWLTMMGIGIAMAISMSTATATATSPSQTVFAAGPSSTLQSIMSASVIGLSLLVTAMLIVGIIFLTARDPAEIGKPERFGSRRLVRYCLWPIPVAMIGGAIMSGFQNTAILSSLNPLVITLLIVVGVASVASYLIMPAAMLRHFMGLMKRIPRPGLVRFAKIEFWAYLVVGGLGLSVYAIALGMLFSAAPAAFAAATTTTAPTAGLSQSGYVGGATSAPAATTGPVAGAFGSGVTTITLSSGQQVIVSTPGLTTMPASMPFAPTAQVMTWGIIAAVAGAGGGCGSFAVGIAGLVFLIMSWRALAKAAGEASQTAAAARAPAPPA